MTCPVQSEHSKEEEYGRRGATEAWRPRGAGGEAVDGSREGERHPASPSVCPPGPSWACHELRQEPETQASGVSIVQRRAEPGRPGAGPERRQEQQHTSFRKEKEVRLRTELSEQHSCVPIFILVPY